VQVETLRADTARWPGRRWALFDLREVGEYAEGHVPGALSLPRRMLEFRLAEVLPSLAWPVVVYDDGGTDGRAALGAARLREMGVFAVSVLRGGLAAVREAGIGLATGTNVPSKHFGEEVLHADRLAAITPEALCAAQAAGARLAICDVRTAPEFAAQHLPGARSFPGFELAAHLPRLLREHDRVVLNCAGRTRSIIASATARALGFDCAAVENGTMGWRLAGLDVEEGAVSEVPSPDPEDARSIADRARELAQGAGVKGINAALLAGRRGEAGQARPLVWDLRSETAFRAGHIPGAVWLPGGQAIQRTDDFLAVPGAPVTLVDDGDARAWLGGWWLARMGCSQVTVLGGGTPAWRAAGLKLAKGAGRETPPFIAAILDRIARVDAAGAAKMLAGGAQVIDVGTSRSFAARHLPGAGWIPRGWLEARIADHAGTQDAVLVTAADPAQAALATDTLQRLGYGRAAALEVGTRAYAMAGGAVETDDAPEDARDVVDPPYAKGLQAMRDYLDWEIRLTAPDRAEQGTTERTDR
jgi:rhodanese-related sulfurtransferase